MVPCFLGSFWPGILVLIYSVSSWVLVGGVFRTLAAADSDPPCRLTCSECKTCMPTTQPYPLSHTHSATLAQSHPLSHTHSVTPTHVEVCAERTVSLEKWFFKFLSDRSKLNENCFIQKLEELKARLFWRRANLVTRAGVKGSGKVSCNGCSCSLKPLNKVPEHQVDKK